MQLRIEAKAKKHKRLMDDRAYFFKGLTPCQQYLAVIQGKIK